MRAIVSNLHCECGNIILTYAKDGHPAYSRCENPKCQHYGRWYVPHRVELEPATPPWEWYGGVDGFPPALPAKSQT